MARSTRPEMAPSLPPKTDELELELDVDEDEDEYVSSDDEDTPRRGFQARLEKIRNNAKGKKKAVVAELSSDEDDSDAEMTLDQPWADKDEDFIDHIQVCPV